MWEWDYKESWMLKNWSFWTVVLEKTLESPSDCKEIQLVHPKGDQSWVLIGRTDVEVETPIFWPLMGRTDLFEKSVFHLMLEKIEGGRKMGQQRMRWLESITLWTTLESRLSTLWTRVWVNSGSWWWAGKPGVLQSMGSQRVGHDWATELN